MNSGWNFMRLLRAGLAAWAFWEVYRTGEWLFLIPGGIFALQAVLNTGCCGSAGCSAPPRGQTARPEEPAVFEEVR